MNLILQVLIFVISLAVLAKSSDYFTDSAEKIGRYFRMPSFVIGVSIVAIGTSLPELISSLIATMQGSSEIAIGNVVGANIANLLLITGIAAVLYKKTIKLDFNFSRLDIALFLFVPILLAITTRDGIFSFLEALICIGVLLIYGWSILSQNNGEAGAAKDSQFDFTIFIIFILSGIFLYLGAKYTIGSVIQIAQILNIGKEIIAISAVSIGTTFPEMMVTVSAVKKNKPAIAIGNVMGSVIFNALAVTGISGLFRNITVPSTVLNFGLPVLIAATALYVLIVIFDKKIAQWEGWMMLIFYIFFAGGMFAIF